MRFLVPKFIIGLLVNTQLLFGERFAHLSYQPKQREVRANQYEIDAFRHELMQYHASNRLTADSNRDRVVILPPVFKLDRANYVDPFWSHWSDPDFKDCQKKFAGWSAHQVLHQMLAYRYAGFRKYAESLPEFENFLITMSSELDRRGQDGCIARELFLKDSAHGNQIIKYLSDKRNYYVEQQQTKQLKQVGFNDQAVQLLREQKAVSQFNCENFNYHQAIQYQQIKEHLNDLAAFQHLDKDSEVAQILTQDSFDYTLLANKANRENLTSVSELFLTVAKNTFALGKGLVAGGVRNLVALADPRTYKHCFDLIGKLGVSLADAAEHLLELSLATVANNQEVVLELKDHRDQNLNQLQNDVGQLYQHLKHTWQESDLEQRSEMIGSVLADGLFIIYGGKVNATMLRTGGKVLAPLSKYKPMALSKLGDLGREINKATGLAYLKKYLRKGNQTVLAGEAGLLSAQELGALCQDLEFLEHVKACDCTNAAHDLNQFEQLNNALQIKEFTSIIKVTKHGLQRLIERGFTATELNDLVSIPDITRI